jgi:predicted nuclease with TOPRIM domain
MSTGKLPAGTEVERLRAERDRLAEARVRAAAEIERLTAAYEDRGEFIEGLSKLQVVESRRARSAEEERDRLREQALTDAEARVVLAFVTYPSLSDPDRRVLFESACEKLRKVSARQQADAGIGTR